MVILCLSISSSCQAMHTELTRQAVDLSVENENLKKASLLLVFNTNIVLSF